MESVTLLATKAIGLLEMAADLETIYPVLRRLSPLQKELYGKHPGPQLMLRFVEDNLPDGGYWWLWTTVPEVDYTRETQWSDTDPLSTEDESELRKHMLDILRLWIREDGLFANPMAMQDVARLLGLTKKSVDAGVKTLNRHIKTGVIRAIRLNKNMIRVLKTDLPQ